ncbi:MAG TPA: sugar phosphate isomerase/epimerase [Terracidiphilus sp.]|jgi:sugar phosphate isomerase/epimerase
MNSSRRKFLNTAAICAAGAYVVHGSKAMGADLTSRPLGLQLYTVGADFDKDPFGTLQKVAAVGYREVELSPVSKVPLKDLRKGLSDNGLRNPSGHYQLPDLQGHLQERIDSAKELGEEYMIVSVPWVADPSRAPSGSKNPMEGFLAMLNGLTLDDWKWNAEQFNKVGEQVKKAGLQLGYHNHNFEFRKIGDTTGYDEFLRLTDPELVALELDCGWVCVAGQDPVTYLKKYPSRYRLLHIKDFKKGFTPSTHLGPAPDAAVPTELGRGAVDYSRILAAAPKNVLLFVEQEPPFKEMPALEAIKVDYDYLHKLTV